MSNNSVYLCYDLKGIHSFIFAVPKLKYISGGSALIDRFDDETARGLHVDGTTYLFSGGGKGAYLCDNSEVATILQEKLVRAAHDEHLTIAIGRNQSYNEAAINADRLFPWLPSADQLDGHPCADSGLYPVPEESQIHPAILNRASKQGDQLNRRYEKTLLEALVLPSYVGDPDKLTFMRNVDARDEDDAGKHGAAALGNRNRWAIIYMDGNDMGSQHREAMKSYANDPRVLNQWISAMSIALGECCSEACRQATQFTLKAWASDQKAIAVSTQENGTVHLPIRPLIVGGDDIVVICHASHAFDFVKEACRVFGEASEAKNKASSIPLWPATGGRLSISAGILFAPVGLPLSTAVPYAESLMASAKGHGRRMKAHDGVPTPACIDWESVTEGFLDTPAARRQRDSLFFDPDINELVSLTRKPYTMDDFEELLKETENLNPDPQNPLPRTIGHAVMDGLSQSYWQRQIASARLGKNQQVLSAHLQEPETLKGKSGRWEAGSGKYQGKEVKMRSTDLVDMLSLLEEKARMSRPTVKED